MSWAKEEISGSIERIKEQVDAWLISSRERSLVLTKLDEAELWLTRCEDA